MKCQKVKTAIVSVTNDLVSDNRVHRTCTTLAEEGYRVILVGRKLPNSISVHRTYHTQRFKLLFKKNIWFYAEYNLHLWIYLLFHRCQLLVANDLDTLPANYFASKIKHCPLLYDSHEYFTEVPELVNRKKVQRCWEKIEKCLVPHLPFAVTVNESLSRIYSEKYHIPFYSIRNLPFKQKQCKKINVDSYFSFPVKHILIYQGALNMGRGIETLIDSISYLNHETVLIIAGQGDIENELKQRVLNQHLSQNVLFLGRIPLDDLFAYTTTADLGFSLEEPMGNNYYYALPNKLFDYIQAGVPVICSDFPEMRNIINQYHVGKTVPSCNSKELASIINEILHDIQQLTQWKENCRTASLELCWEKEKQKLIQLLPM